MITKFKIYEGIKWYSKGKFVKDDSFDENENSIFQVGDRVYGESQLFWYAKISKRSSTTKDEGFWCESKKPNHGYIDKIDYCEDVEGYTGQVIQLKAYWPWFQANGFRKM